MAICCCSVCCGISPSSKAGMGFAECAPCIQHLLFPDNTPINSLEFQVPRRASRSAGSGFSMLVQLSGVFSFSLEKEVLEIESSFGLRVINTLVRVWRAMHALYSCKGCLQPASLVEVAILGRSIQIRTCLVNSHILPQVELSSHPPIKQITFSLTAIPTVL
ncbi:hypothetical protein BDW59DRAFT_143560 [Aspergillus cavernicola]|uniref:Uncharacterized protein n=1 Tax=Aspergillus cavernicola TaxID=176166 RepID=A0ABR4IM21_9EURO